MKRILITGGSGFIGTNLLEKFIRDGYKVLNIDINKPKVFDHINYWENVDITHFEALQKKVSSFKPNYIIHLAARTDIEGLSIDDYKANTLGVKNVMDIAKEIDSLEKIIFDRYLLKYADVVFFARFIRRDAPPCSLGELEHLQQSKELLPE